MTAPSTFLRQQRLSILFLFFAIFLLTCKSGGAGCDNYIGDWMSPEKHFFDSTWRFNITKNGDTYIMQADMQGFIHGTHALSCEQNQLVLKGLPLSGDVPLTLINDGKNILLVGATFHKVEVPIQSK